MKQSSVAIALAFVGVMFFAIGFAFGINSFLSPTLNSIFGIKSSLSYLVLGISFVPFLLFAVPATWTIKKIGYKRTMALSFLIFAISFALFILAADFESIAVFLIASFVGGIGNAYLNAAANPYITILGPIESAARRISIMGICNKFAWPAAVLFFSLILKYMGISDTSAMTASDLNFPFYIIIGVFLLLGIMSLLAPLPEVTAAGEDENSVEDCPYAANKTSILQFPHAILGALSLFIYTGVETLSLGTAYDYATSIGLENPNTYSLLPTIGMVAGYICGIIFIPKYISQSMALRICSIIGVVGSLAIVLAPADISVWMILILGLGCSLGSPAIWPLSLKDLGKFTKTGSSLLVMGIAGGAVFPPLYGWLKDDFGAQQAYWLCLPCFLFILFFSLYGYKIRTHSK